jgi:DNA-binding transcriptional ArsR family regulator
MLNKPSIDRIFHALADPTRRDMVETLAAGSLPVTVLARRYDMSLSAVSQHLKVLIDGGVVQSVKDGRTRTCSIQAPALDFISAWASARRLSLASRLSSLERYLAAERKDPQ